MAHRRSRLKQFLVDTGASIAPGLTEKLLMGRTRRHNEDLQKRLGLSELYDKVAAQHGSSVLSGPFKGMKYTGRAAGSLATPKLLGSYEAELHPAIEAVLARSPDTVIDIGVAEGYYAVGLARRLPSARVIGYDIDADARNKCAAMARLNGLDQRIDIRGVCTHEALRESLTSATLVVCDCEGCEFDLIDPVAVPELASADLVVELHDFSRAGLGQTLVSRFASTHDTEILPAVTKDPAHYPLSDLSPTEQRLAVDELRHSPQQWVVMLARREKTHAIEPTLSDRRHTGDRGTSPLRRPSKAGVASLA